MSGSRVPGCTSSTATIAPRPRTSPITPVARRPASCSAVEHHRPEPARPRRPGPAPRSSRSRRARPRRRPGCRRRCRRARRRARASMISARPVTAASGSPPAMPLAVVIRSGTMPSCSQANHVAGAAEAGLDLVGDEHDRRWSGRTRPARAGSPARGTMKPPSPWIGSITTAGDVARRRPASSIRSIALGRGLARAALRPAGPAERVGHRHPVDLGRERPEAVLVRHVLRGQRHREVGAAVVAVVEARRRPCGRWRPGDLHGVLHRLGAGVEQRRALLVVAGREPGQRLAHRDVALVRRDHEAGVGERAPTCSGTARDHRGWRCRR